MTRQTTTPCLRLLTTVPSAEALSWQLDDLGALAIEQQDATTMHKAAANRAVLIAGFADGVGRDQALAALRASIDPSDYVEAVDITDDGWGDAWRAFFKPVVLSMIEVTTPWMQPTRPELQSVIIDPGQAFGTGGHATTRLILRLLEQRVSRGTCPERLLDVGTGSGILAICAVKLGATRVTAVDIDEECIAQTQKNAQRNGVAAHIDAAVGSAENLDDTWDLVLANIDLAAFRSCAEAIARTVSPTGEALLSGLLVDQVEECLACWPGFTATQTITDDGWAAVVVRRGR